MGAVRAAGVGLLLAFAGPMLGVQAAAAQTPAIVVGQHQVQVTVRPGAVLIPPIRLVAPAIPKAAQKTLTPLATTVVQQMTNTPPIASSVGDVTHSKGRVAGLALIVVNIFVGVAALVLNRRRRSS